MGRDPRQRCRCDLRVLVAKAVSPGLTDLTKLLALRGPIFGFLHERPHASLPQLQHLSQALMHMSAYLKSQHTCLFPVKGTCKLDSRAFYTFDPTLKLADEASWGCRCDHG